MNFTGLITVTTNGKVRFCTSYKFNADMYLYQLLNFFKSYDPNSIKRMFLDMSWIGLKDYDELVKLAGLYDYYNFDESIWSNPEGLSKFILIYPELDARCFINGFSGTNVFETLMATNRRKVLDNQSQTKATHDFTYNIDLDSWSMNVKSIHYPSRIMQLPRKGE